MGSGQTSAKDRDYGGAVAQLSRRYHGVLKLYFALRGVESQDVGDLAQEVCCMRSFGLPGTHSG
jgi:hypothetical protein